MKREILAAAATALALFAASPASAAYSAATTNGWFTVAGREADTATRSDLWLFNPSTAPGNVTVTLVFHPGVASGQAQLPPVISSIILLGARQTKYLPDVTATALAGADGVFGALEWQSSGAVLGLLRNVTLLGNVTGIAVGATAGPIVAGTPRSESMTAKTSASDAVNVLHLFGLNSADPFFTTLLDVANTSDTVLPVEVKVINPVTGSVFGGTLNFSIAKHSLLRVGPILNGLPLIEGLRITVAVKEGTVLTAGGVIATATVTDLRTGDSYAVTGQREPPGAASSGPCVPDAQSLCLSNGRFRVQATWQTATASGTATAIPGTSDTGQFWFFDAANVEMVVKVLNGCVLSNHYWVFAGGLTDVGVVMTVTDMKSGMVRIYTNSLKTPFAPIQDTSAFATCP